MAMNARGEWHRHHNPIPLPWDYYGYRAVAFTLGISSRLERVFFRASHAHPNNVEPITLK
ncbi:TPA: hypothetical protein ACYU9W_002752 [Klebsiella pneumoniae]